MKSFSKLIGLLLLGLLLLLVAAGFALTHFFDPNDYKDEIRQLAHKHANLELELNGDIGWSLFPWLGIEITDAKVASADTPDKPFADVRLLGLSVQVLPLLLRKEIQMSDIRIDGLNLSLQRNVKGQANWENIGQLRAAHPSVTAQDAQLASTIDTAQTAQTSAPANTPLQLDINSLIINGARIDYRDEHSGQQFNLESVQLTTGAIRDNQPIALKFSGFSAMLSHCCAHASSCPAKPVLIRPDNATNLMTSNYQAKLLANPSKAKRPTSLYAATCSMTKAHNWHAGTI